MDRLNDVVNNLKVNRFLALYGIGVNDSYIQCNLIETDLCNAIVQPLNEAGYSRVIFTSPTQPIYFNDSRSKELSSSFLWLGDDLNRANSPFHSMQPGPFGNKILLPGSPSELRISYDSIGDTHLLKILDAALHEHDGPPTVLVIVQAENYIQNNQDQRSLSSIIESWISLPTNNHNRCIFLFNANDYSELAEIATTLPIPSIRSLIFRDSTKGRRKCATICLGGPTRDEAVRMVKFLQKNKWTEFQPEFVDKLIDQICIESEPLQTWLSRLSNEPFIDRNLAYQSGWFSHFRGDLLPAVERLNALVGLDEIKERILELSGWAANRKSLQSKQPNSPLLHMVFSGYPGTGKTTVARLVGELFFDLKILKKGHLVEVKASDLIADYVGGTAIKTNQMVDQALGGILFIDEAYSLSARDRGGFGSEAIETILTRMEDNRDELVIILAGYPDQINAFLKSNPGISRRFPVENRFVFKDFDADQLEQIFQSMLKERDLHLNRQFHEAVSTIISAMASQHPGDFGNAGDIRNFVDSLERKCLSRLFQSGKKSHPILSLEDLSDEYKSYLPREVPSIALLLEELDGLVGLDEVKNFLKKKVNRIQFDHLRNQEKFDEESAKSLHLIFTGNPGTGKTTVARLIGKIYASMGILRKGHTVEVSMPDLIAGYVGQTTGKVMEQVNKAIDGVLFIDEAYALVRGNSLFQGSFGQEVIDTLVKALEDNRGHLCVILAGYSKEMDILIRSNPGLRSRFTQMIKFADFTRENSQELLDRLLLRDQFKMAEPVKSAFINQLDNQRISNPASFGNARQLLSSYDQVKDRLADRIVNQLQNRKTNQADISQAWLEIILEDVIISEYTVVIDGNETDSAQRNSAMKSWVIPKE